MRHSRNRRRKIRRFGLLGAAGCLLGALLGELYLRLLPVPANQARCICLLVDCSGSMRQNGKLAEVQQVALDFVRRQDLRHNRIAVVAFATQAEVVAPLTDNIATLETAINNLGRYFGSTRTDVGLEVAADALRAGGGSRNLLLFTDGKPDAPVEAARAAAEARRSGIRLIAVATPDADMGQLAEMTGDDSLVFRTDSGQFATAFASAERVMSGPQLMDTGARASGGPLYRAIRVGGWTACLAIGLALALVIAQNRTLGQPLLSGRQWLTIPSYSVAAGLLAGAVGDLIFSGAGSSPALELPARLAAWALLGGLVGFGLAFFVPNLPLLKATAGGAIGGALGAFGFYLASRGLGDLSGRLSGALLLGFLIGLMIALVEHLSIRPRVEARRIVVRHSLPVRRMRW